MRNHEPPLSAEAPATLVYTPYLLGAGVAHIFNEKTNVTLSDDQVWRIDLSGETGKRKIRPDIGIHDEEWCFTQQGQRIENTAAGLQGATGFH